MNRSLRTLAMTLAVVGSLLMEAGPAAATSHQPTGSRINLLIADGTTYPAATAFYVQHGVSFDPADPAAGKYRFGLDVDGVARAASYSSSTSYPDGSLLSRQWVFNVPSGLVGTHRLTGHWLAPCGSTVGVDCAGKPRNTLVQILTMSATVTFS